MNSHSAFRPSLNRLYRRRAALGLWLLVIALDLLHLLIQLVAGYTTA